MREGTPIENQKVSDYLSGKPLQGYEKVVDVEVDDSTSVERSKESGCLPEEFVTVSDILKKAVYSEKVIEEKEYQYVVRVIDSLKKAFKI